jgi:hypothetical protein
MTSRIGAALMIVVAVFLMGAQFSGLFGDRDLAAPAPNGMPVPVVLE